MVRFSLVATARSGLLSPFKSPIATDLGNDPVPYVAGRANDGADVVAASAIPPASATPRQAIRRTGPRLPAAPGLSLDLRPTCFLDPIHVNTTTSSKRVRRLELVF